MPAFAGWDEGRLALSQADPVLKAIIDLFPNRQLQPRGQLFHTLIRAIVGQQISVKAAQTVWERFVAVCGSVDPEAIARCSEGQLRSAGLSQRKASYILGISQDPVRCDTAHLSPMSDEQVLKTLSAYRGVGEWTAQMCMMFSLCRPDILPLKDIGLRRAVEKHYNRGERMTDAALIEVAQPWRPWRTIATWYLWRSLDSPPTP